MNKVPLLLVLLCLTNSLAGLAQSFNARPEATQKPVLHGRHWMAITGKPLAATAGASVFSQGGNAVDAACAMLAATCTMWDVLSWGGETQALIYNPKTGKVIGLNALGVAPTGATPEFFKAKGMNFPPEYGPLAAVTPGTPGGLCTMLAEYGTMSLKSVLAPAMTLADGYPIEAQTANAMERGKEAIKQWPYSKAVFLPHLGETREAPEAGEIFRQKGLFETLTHLSLGGEDRKPKPGAILLQSATPEWIRKELFNMGYKLSFDERTSGPINAIYFDWSHGSFWGGSSNHGEDYGISW